MYFVLFLLCIISCISPGINEKVRDRFSIPTNINDSIALQLSDSLFKENKYQVPESYVCVDYFPYKNIRCYYFNETPKEIYIIGFSYYLNLIRVEDETGKMNTKTGNTETERIIKRFKETVLMDIVKKAKELGIPDSSLFRIYP